MQGVQNVSLSYATPSDQLRSVRGPREKDLAAQAGMHLARVRYLQTYTSGWSGTVHFARRSCGRTAMPTLGVISAAVVQDELRRKLTAITQAIREAAPGDVMDLQLRAS